MMTNTSIPSLGGFLSKVAVPIPKDGPKVFVKFFIIPGSLPAVVRLLHYKTTRGTSVFKYKNCYLNSAGMIVEGVGDFQNWELAEESPYVLTGVVLDRNFKKSPTPFLIIEVKN